MFGDGLIKVNGIVVIRVAPRSPRDHREIGAEFFPREEFAEPRASCRRIGMPAK